MIRIFTIALLFILLFVGHIEAQTQWSPQPGSNCGVGYMDPTNVDANPNNNGTKPFPDFAIEPQYACCNPVINKDLYPEPSELLGGIPVIGTILTPLGNLLSPLEWPKAVVPILPSVRDFLDVSAPDPCLVGTGQATDPNGACYCKAGASALASLVRYCNNIKSDNEKKECISCFGYDPNQSDISTGKFISNGQSAGIWTGLGCLKVDLATFIQETVLGLGIGLAGITALLCIIYGAFLMQTSAGDAERVKSAQELITSCITGLIIIIFSVIILKVIGIDILRIPGFK